MCTETTFLELFHILHYKNVHVEILICAVTSNINSRCRGNIVSERVWVGRKVAGSHEGVSLAVLLFVESQDLRMYGQKSAICVWTFSNFYLL